MSHSPADDNSSSTPELRRDVTRILQDIGAGQVEGGAAAAQLLPLVYQQLRAIAQQRMNNERKDHTLQATALVHEAYVKLVGGPPGGSPGGPPNGPPNGLPNGLPNEQAKWSSRGAFFKAAAEAMRRILIDHARTRGRVKRGGEAKREHMPPGGPLSVMDLASDADSEEILALDDAIRRLEGEDGGAEVAEVVRLRFFAGLSGDDTAEALGISPRQVDRHWAYARARLFQLLKAQRE